MIEHRSKYKIHPAGSIMGRKIENDGEFTYYKGKDDKGVGVPVGKVERFSIANVPPPQITYEAQSTQYMGQSERTAAIAGLSEEKYRTELQKLMEDPDIQEAEAALKSIIEEGRKLLPQSSYLKNRLKDLAHKLSINILHKSGLTVDYMIGLEAQTRNIYEFSHYLIPEEAQLAISNCGTQDEVASIMEKITNRLEAMIHKKTRREYRLKPTDSEHLPNEHDALLCTITPPPSTNIAAVEFYVSKTSPYDICCIWRKVQR